MTKNPALTILTWTAIVGVILGGFMLWFSLAGMFTTNRFDGITMTWDEPVNNLPVWICVAVVAVGVIAAVGALILWGMQRTQQRD